MPTPHKTHPRARSRKARPSSESRIASRPRERAPSRRTKNMLLAGAAVLATGAAGTAAVLMRRQLGELALEAAAEAVSASRSIGRLRGRMGRKSLFVRLLPTMGVITALVAVAGAAFFVVVPGLRSAKFAARATPAVAGQPSVDARPKSNSVHDGEEVASHAAT
jgi:hypothetical protein